MEEHYQSPPPYSGFSMIYTAKDIFRSPDGLCNILSDSERLARTSFFRAEDPSHLGVYASPVTPCSRRPQRSPASAPSHGAVGDPADRRQLIAEDVSGNRLTFRVGLPLGPSSHIFADDFESGGPAAWSKAGPP